MDNVTGPDMYCRTCGYALVGLQNRKCPECGTPFNPNDPGSFRRTRLSPFAESCLQPIGRPMFVTYGIVALALLALGMRPWFYYMGHIVFLFCMWATVLLFSFFLIALRLFVVAWWDEPAHRVIADFRRWVWLGLLMLTTTVLLCTQIPLRLGFLTALPGVRTLVNDLRSGAALSADRRCGLYKISATAKRDCNIPGCHIFYLADRSESGFVHSPNGINGLLYNAGNKGHLIGDWYWIAED